jgi:hypothetical protein
VRTRLQRIVDRRFDRPRIEAEQTLQRHGERLAPVVELDVIERDVLETVAATVRPPPCFCGSACRTPRLGRPARSRRPPHRRDRASSNGWKAVDADP